MKRLLILGAGTAGTMAANKLRDRLPAAEWHITVVEPSETHNYQPGYLFIPFGTYKPSQVVKKTKRLLDKGVTTEQSVLEAGDADGLELEALGAVQGHQ